MKAIVVSRYGGPEVLEPVEVNDLTPGPGQVLVEVRSAGVNPVDTYRRAGSQGYEGSLPFTPGIDGAGVVLSTGEQERDTVPDAAMPLPGSRVYLSGSVTGTYAGQCLCTPDQVHDLPETDASGRPITFEDGASLWVNYGTAFRALFQRGEAKAGDTILVHGATGGVGIAAIQFANEYGLKVIGTAGSEAGLALLREQGVALAVSHNDPDRAEAIVDATEGGPAVIVEMLANANLEMDMGMIARGGRIVVVGSRGSIEVTPRRIMGTEADIRGLTLYSATPAELVEIHDATARALHSGAIKPVIQARLPLNEAAEAHRAVIEDRSHGKIVLIP
jgi:NADPH2:quinone reductase